MRRPDSRNERVRVPQFAAHGERLRGARPAGAHLGARAVELVIGQLLHNEFGIPAEPSLTTIPAKLVEGPTLRGLVAPPNVPQTP